MTRTFHIPSTLQSSVSQMRKVYESNTDLETTSLKKGHASRLPGLKMPTLEPLSSTISTKTKVWALLNKL